mgnify:CR=1 FL=1
MTRRIGYPGRCGVSNFTVVKMVKLGVQLRRTAGRVGRLTGALLVASLLVSPGPADADTGALITPDWDYHAAQVSGSVERTEAIYHPQSGSYFQLVMDWQSSNQGPNWLEARATAARLTYRGRPGRLAVIPDLDTHKWLARRFNLAAVGWWDAGATWIGLRYWCATRSLAWVDGTSMVGGQAGPWAHPWHRDQHTCQNNRFQFMGVYYNGVNWRWQAVGPAKRFPFLFVEYPAPAGAAAGRAGARE